MITLGIETSCDETALALIETRSANGAFECRVISSLIHSQADLHSSYGGVFPTLAKREHERNLVPLLQKLFEQSSISNSPTTAFTAAPPSAIFESFKKDYAPQNPDLTHAVMGAAFLTQRPAIDLIAVTQGPGLEPALWTGIVFAEMLSKIWDVPITPVDHMEGHIIGSLLHSDAPSGAWQQLKPLPKPSLAFLVSGGHTELVRVADIGSYEIIGQTKDDAVGEAFDKAARLLGLPYPGGPHISKMAAQARAEGLTSPVKLPRPMISSKDLAFSFSGLKTAVLYAVRGAEKTGEVSDGFRKGLAREFENAAVETLIAKLRAGIDRTDAQGIIIGGGVSANVLFREQCAGVASEYGIPLYMPSQHVSGDNALMIALAGSLHASASAGPIRAHGTKRLGA